MYRKYNFTEQQVLDAITTYRADTGFDEPVCLDMLNDAREADTLEDAVNIIIVDSAYWNGTW